MQQRVRALKALLTKGEVTVITTFDGLMDRLRPLEQVKKEILTIGPRTASWRSKHSRKKLVRLGYEAGRARWRRRASSPCAAASWTFTH